MENKPTLAIRPSNTQLAIWGVMGSLAADLFGAFFYIVVGGAVVYEMEWLMGVWIFVPALGILGLFAGPLFGIFSGRIVAKLNIKTPTPKIFALVAGALPILLIWLYLFATIWIDSAQLRGRILW